MLSDGWAIGLPKPKRFAIYLINRVWQRSSGLLRVAMTNLGWQECGQMTIYRQAGTRTRNQPVILQIVPFDEPRFGFPGWHRGLLVTLAVGQERARINEFLRLDHRSCEAPSRASPRTARARSAGSPFGPGASTRGPTSRS